MKQSALPAALREIGRSASWPPWAADRSLAELQARYQRPGSRYVTLDGTRVHVVEEGRREAEAPVLVLLHGLLASLHTWDGWIEACAPHYRVLRLDLPGFGLTGPFAHGAHELERLVSFFERFCDAEGLTQFDLAGNSLGGFLAWRYAARQPERVRRLVLLSPLGYPQPMLPFVALLAAPGVNRLAGQMNFARGIARGVRDVYGVPERVQPGIVERYQELALRPGNRAALLDYCAQLVQMHRRGGEPREVRELGMPVQLQWGALDRWIPPAHVERWRRDVPQLEWVHYDDVGHVPMEEVPARSVAAALQFLRR